MLELEGVESAYGSSRVLFGVDLTVGEGEVVSLLGRNGMGKTTTVRAITGLTPPRAGTIRFRGRRIDGRPAYRIARAGIGLVPEGRQIFPNLSVEENLVAAARGRGWDLAAVYGLFPRLAERRDNPGTRLSGGEQQMLAIGRALMTNPRLLILDEATEGLAPVIRSDIWACIRRLRELGQSLLIIDAGLEALLAVCDRHYIIDRGRIAWHGDGEAFRAEAGALQRRYLSV
ncbi:High-affinity branched-chain amino acid transport ATP-binding protein LivF [wastewater metagenome]|uniref:High-affinity branched-chain amino acid transport ATP-binding protein LivF n=4 Tax=root TaxID=1 RepID=A0A5B8RCF0_9ZZZZ|nr:ABC transporter ATP-binding protein [Arhodomonas aquaeolei]MCS4503999.1 ABC transporter ATP-binding protein [Arhodomonas aquaeolei]QEA05773.1 high-affinity branched-chain amino acid transport ATP-binding protein LivF [uncultured organism]